MKILVVFCHPLKDSFNYKVLESVEIGLKQSGHEYQIADLYRESFQPAMIAEDFAQFTGNSMPAEIQFEQQRVEWSDGLVFIFPVWWWSIPAMLKGWIDRVMTYGWAWEDPSNPASSNLKDRKILVLASAGASKEAFAKRKYDEALFTQLNVGTWSYCGMNDVTTEILHDITPESSEAFIKNQLHRVQEIFTKVFGRAA